MITDKKDQLINLVRSLMYGTDDLIGDAYAISELMSELDGVPVSQENNRLLKSIQLLKSNDRIDRHYSYINTINED